MKKYRVSMDVLVGVVVEAKTEAEALSKAKADFEDWSERSSIQFDKIAALTDSAKNIKVISEGDV